MKVSNAISFRVSKIIQNKQFVKDILNSIACKSGRALLVGGAVRDLFLDFPIKDLDFEVYGLHLEELQQILELYGTVSLVGKSFGVLRLHGLDVDWSLPRKDSSGRHPVVAYDPHMNYEQAFARRDLTINAMGIDMQTFELIDPYGGLHDLQNKILRSPDLEFFAQDPLRLVRVMQFVGRFEMQVDEKLSQLCRTIDISQVSQERIEQEFTKLFLQSKRPSLGLQWLADIGKLELFFPDLVLNSMLSSKLNFAAKLQYADQEEKLVIMYALIISCISSSIEPQNFGPIDIRPVQKQYLWLHDIVLHQDRRKKILLTIAYARIIQQPLSDVQIKWLAYWLAPELSIRFLSKFMMLRLSQEQAVLLVERAVLLGVADQPQEPLLTGKDFLGVAFGKELGDLVKKAYQIQLDEGMCDKDALCKRVLLVVKK